MKSKTILENLPIYFYSQFDFEDGKSFPSFDVSNHSTNYCLNLLHKAVFTVDT